jgi:hypothetical protein
MRERGLITATSPEVGHEDPLTHILGLDLKRGLLVIRVRLLFSRLGALPVIFQLTDKMRLAGAERCWELQRMRMRKNRTTGKREESWESFQYYTSLPGAVRCMAEYDLRMAADAADFGRRIHRLESLVDNAVADLCDRLAGRLD